MITDIIRIIIMKIVLKARSDGNRLCEQQVFTELLENLNIITRNFPTHDITKLILNLQLIDKLNTGLDQS